jgi:hypothetical protein
VIGYSQQIVCANRDADSRNTGVKLGRFCIARGIPVTDVMDFFGVSKQCVYNWFIGRHEPNRLFSEAITEYLRRAR